MSDLESFEVAQLCNLAPDSTEEALALIPSLSRFEEETLEAIISNLASVR